MHKPSEPMLRQPSLTWALFLSLIAFFACSATPGATPSKPNVVFILADDLGWSDTTLYGTTSLYRTPNIERLAARGMTFSQAYADSPLCSPTRASILTGLSPARHGITSPSCHLPQITLSARTKKTGPADQKATIPQSVTRLRTDYYTLAEMLRDNGYTTGHFGKWHLGAAPYSPLEHGFDIDIPHHAGPGPAGSYVAPWKFKDFDHDPDIPDQHLEDRMAAEATAFLEANCERPFFLNYWMFSVHAPFDAKRSLVEKYRKLVDSDSPQRSPTYAAMIESMDDAVGTLLDTLERLGVADNTIIIFASDNGGNMYNEVDGATATSNRPLRGGKATMYEGGVRGPAIVVYPNQVAAGTRSDAIIQTCDYYPTLLEILKIDAQPEQVFDGISILPALKGEPLLRPAIFSYFPHAPKVPDWLPPAVSVRSGDWKLIRIFFGGEEGKHDYKLFHLKEDLGEQVNLYGQFPDRAQRLDKLIDGFLERTGAVLPTPNPNFDASKHQAESIGQAELKRSGGKRANQARLRNKQPPVEGWQAGGTCKLSIKNQCLQITCDGGDPHASYSLPTPAGAKSLSLNFTMTSNSHGEGQVFWQEQGVKPMFAAERSVRFDVQHDGQSHEYQVAWSSDSPVLAIRIDPCTAKGQVSLEEICLKDESGKEWFCWPQ